VSLETVCKSCGRSFTPKFSFQQKRLEDGGFEYYCSQLCANPVVSAHTAADCAVCGKRFAVTLVSHILKTSTGAMYVCGAECRAAALSPVATIGQRARRLAVMNQKGGTGKTTTAINIAAGLAEHGFRTLLVDMDPQGSVGVSLGINGELTTANLIRDGSSAEQCAVPIRDNLDVITSDESLAEVEVLLARAEDGPYILRRRLGAVEDYRFVVLDCAPSITLLTRNALNYAGEVVVPVACDYLSMVGTRQISRTIGDINDVMKHDVRITGVIPTFFDVRNRISHTVLEELRRTYGDLVLAPVRINTRLKEAPVHRKTIFEYAPDSHGAEDYKVLVDELIRRS
jgi:chromosome partitioning protein